MPPGPAISPALPVPKSKIRDQARLPLIVTQPSIVTFVSPDMMLFGKSMYASDADAPPGKITCDASRLEFAPRIVPLAPPTESITVVPLPSLKLYRFFSGETYGATVTVRVAVTEPTAFVAVSVYVVVVVGNTTVVPVVPEIAGAPLLMLTLVRLPEIFHESATGVPEGTLAEFDEKLTIVGSPRPNVGPSLT